MQKLKQFLRWFLFAAWLGLGLYAVLVDLEQNWRLMFAGACFLLAANNAFDGGKGVNECSTNYNLRRMGR